jgi:hypothetical protein
MFIIGHNRMTSHCTISHVPQIGDRNELHQSPSTAHLADHTRGRGGCPAICQGSTPSRGCPDFVRARPFQLPAALGTPGRPAPLLQAASGRKSDEHASSHSRILKAIDRPEGVTAFMLSAASSHAVGPPTLPYANNTGRNEGARRPRDDSRQRLRATSTAASHRDRPKQRSDLRTARPRVATPPPTSRR